MRDVASKSWTWALRDGHSGLRDGAISVDATDLAPRNADAHALGRAGAAYLMNPPRLGDHVASGAVGVQTVRKRSRRRRRATTQFETSRSASFNIPLSEPPFSRVPHDSTAQSARQLPTRKTPDLRAGASRKVTDNRYVVVSRAPRLMHAVDLQLGRHGVARAIEAAVTQMRAVGG